MAAAAHLKELENKHAHLDEKIKQEMKHPSSDTLRLSKLKKQKLQLKQKIEAYQAS